MLETYGEMQERERKERRRETARFWMAMIQGSAVIVALWIGYWELVRMSEQTEAIREQVELQKSFAWIPLSG